MKGSYYLFIKLDKLKKIKIGKLGVFNFPRGFYCYVGSAMNNLDARIQRHLGNNKKLHWHIDYLLEHAKVVEVKKFPSTKKRECILSNKIGRKSVIIAKGFGSSDCNCPTHLWYLGLNKYANS